MRGWLLPLFAVLAGAAGAERINHEGRLLGEVPGVTNAVQFHTPEADAVVAAMQIMPRDNPWNEDISRRPLLSNSAAIISRITNDLYRVATNRLTLRAFYEMNYVLVPDAQPRVPITFLDYPDESDLDGGTNDVGLYPIPANLPIETWPKETGSATLDQWQQNTNSGDRHAIIVTPGSGFIWETWQTRRSNTTWRASNGAKFSLNSNGLRPDGWTSGDAAGLPMFPALVRYDECQRGRVEHALRVVVNKSRRAYVYPATHYASTNTAADYPAMGQRLRLMSNFSFPTNWTTAEKAVIYALKKYGALVADNGGFFSISVCPDPRFSNQLDHLRLIAITNFEVVASTGPLEGPRSPGTPTVNAGPDRLLNAPGTITLTGSVTATGSVSVAWTNYAGPGNVVWANPTAAVTTATFPVPGTYLLRLGAEDGVHTPSYDMTVVEVRFPLVAGVTGSNVSLDFPTATGRSYAVDRCAQLSGPWLPWFTNVVGNGGTTHVVHTNGALSGRQFYRARLLP